MADIVWWDRKAEVFILAGEALFPDFGLAEQLIDYRILSSFSSLLALSMKLAT